MTSSGSDAGGRLLSGVAWNAAGRGLPLLLALVLTPVLLGQLGLERWGLFTLALAMVGVFGVFDLGVGQALTRALAERIGAERIGPERIGAGREEDGAALVGSALAALLAISAVVAIALWFSMPALVRSVLNVPPDLAAEAIAGLRVLAAAAPLVVINAALWGVLAAFQRFRAANLVNIPISVFYYLGPVLLLLVWDSLVGVMPGWGLTVLLPQAIGVRRAREMSFTGNFLSAEEALHFGLVNHVVPHEQLLPFTRALAADIIGNDQAGVGQIRRTYAEVTAEAE